MRLCARAGEMRGDRLQEMITLSDRQRRRRALQQRELLVREREGTLPRWRGELEEEASISTFERRRRLRPKG
jgi:hypothetical protein